MIVRTLREQIPVPLEELPAGEAAGLLTDAVEAAGRAVDAFDPFKGGRLAAPVGLAVHRVVAGRAKALAPTPGKARSISRDRTRRTLRDFTRSVAPWQAWLEPDPRLAGVLGGLDAEDARLLADRFGLADHVPLTLGEIAERLALPRMHAARRVRSALRRAMEAARRVDSG